MKTLPKRLLYPLLLIAFSVVLSGCGGGSLTVNTNDDVDDGTCNAQHCSLREAIEKANSLTVKVVIKFNIGGGGPQTIQPTYGLPSITRPTTIDGTTQPGYASEPLIELDGSLAITMGGDGFFDGLAITGGDTTVKGLAINRFEGNGIRLAIQGGNRILGCFIGTNRTGTGAAGNGTQVNSPSAGILIYSGGSNFIGGTAAGMRNVISGNHDAGVRILSDANSVINNFIGTNAAGTAALGNQGDGVLVAGGMNAIGGKLGSTGNVISGNIKNGVSISTPTNDVKGNLIGLDAAGTSGLGNHLDGVWVGANLTGVGGTAAGEGNIISGNFTDGIGINADSVEVAGNYIGTDITGTAAVGNQRNGMFVMSQGGVLIGGDAPAATNVISGNQNAGIWIDGSSNDVSIFGNSIGTDKNGTAALGNGGSGIRLSGTNHRIGSIHVAYLNVISGNGGAGITIVNPATGIKIQQNHIGLDADGHVALGNDIGIEFAPGAGDSDVLIGGDIYGEGNDVSGNVHEGLLLYNNAEVYGNRIGINGGVALPNGGDGIRITGDNNVIGDPHNPNVISYNGGHGVAVIADSGTATGNHITGNDIRNNAGLGIAIDEDAVLINDPLDADTGDNGRQNHPDLMTVHADPAAETLTLVGKFSSQPNTVYTIEVFATDACDPSGYGEGQQLINDFPLTTNAEGYAVINRQVWDEASTPWGGFFTATATDPDGNTSGFSNCVAMTELPAAVTSATEAPMGMLFTPYLDPAGIFWGRCTPDTARISVEIANPPEEISYVLLFARLMDPKSGEKTDWSEGLSMLSGGKNIFFYDLSAYAMDDFNKFGDGVVQYQFVVYNKAQAVIGRSEVYGDLAFQACGKPAGVANTPTPKNPLVGP